MVAQMPAEKQATVSTKEEQQMLRRLNASYLADVDRLESQADELRQESAAKDENIKRLEAQVEELQRQLGEAQGLAETLKKCVLAQEAPDFMEAPSDGAEVKVKPWEARIDWSSTGLPKQFMRGQPAEDNEGIQVDWSTAALPMALRPRRRAAGPKGARRARRCAGSVQGMLALKTPALRAAIALVKATRSEAKPSSDEAIQRATPSKVLNGRRPKEACNQPAARNMNNMKHSAARTTTRERR